ncbi:DinB family protein [Fictibacillus sp. KIGAM418]|uniref:DinB family protein n=1 Tax=Fictibacillus marinisediminis TaxID=2878389 RepID=A0A9X1XAS8_9BACL|nr:DinB family protein [Fictibacillus marinisediminis]MCK6257432.1 DinB family protein [Fictibacillus marinisediminis]
MQGINELKEMLLEELELIARTSTNLIGKISPNHLDYRPKENMRSLHELVLHLVSVPSTDLLILQEKSEEEVRELEAEVAADNEPEQWIVRMKNGLHDVRSYMEQLPDEVFLQKETKPFYLDYGTVQAKWLIEIVTHAQHHRAQLFNYLKELGYDVNMFDLY